MTWEPRRPSRRTRYLPVLVPSGHRPPGSGTHTRSHRSARLPGTSGRCRPPRLPWTRSRDRRPAAADVRDELASRVTETSGSGVRRAAERRRRP